jgi:putative endonuclease
MSAGVAELSSANTQHVRIVINLISHRANTGFMYYVYILFSLKDRKLYTGYTSNIKRRIKQHKNGEAKSTVDRRPLKLIYYEVYLIKQDAEKREKYLKGGNGRSGLKIQLRECLKRYGYKFL